MFTQELGHPHRHRRRGKLLLVDVRPSGIRMFALSPFSNSDCSHGQREREPHLICAPRPQPPLPLSLLCGLSFLPQPPPPSSLSSSTQNQLRTRNSHSLSLFLLSSSSPPPSSVLFLLLVYVKDDARSLDGGEREERGESELERPRRAREKERRSGKARQRRGEGREARDHKMGHNLLQVPLPPPSPSLSDRGVGHDSSAKLLKMEMRMSLWCDSRRIGRLIKETIIGG